MSPSRKASEGGQGHTLRSRGVLRLNAEQLLVESALYYNTDLDAHAPRPFLVKHSGCFDGEAEWNGG